MLQLKEVLAQRLADDVDYEDDDDVDYEEDDDDDDDVEEPSSSDANAIDPVHAGSAASPHRLR